MSASEATNFKGSRSDHYVNFGWPCGPADSADQAYLEDTNAWAEIGWSASPFSDISDISYFRIPVLLAVQRLYLAARLATDCELERREFSIPWDELSRMDLRREELKWLQLKNVVKESESAFDPDRHESHPNDGSEFAPDAMFVISDLGIELVDQCKTEVGLRQSENKFSNSQLSSARQDLKPSWDGERHELHCGRQVVKKFKWRAANQETILATFEEEGWPAHIDDPLPQEPSIDPKRRLADAIKSLNRHQKNSLVRFCGDGTGQGVLWELK